MRGRLAGWLLVIWVPAIFVGSFMSREVKDLLGLGLRYVSLPIPGMHLHVNPHRIYHFAVFAVTAWLFEAVVQSRRNRILMAIAACALALLAEKGENFIYHIRMEWGDVGDDFAGIASALLLNVLWRARSENSNPAADEK